MQWVEKCADESEEAGDRAKLTGSAAVGEKKKEAKKKGSWVNKIKLDYFTRNRGSDCCSLQMNSLRRQFSYLPDMH